LNENLKIWFFVTAISMILMISTFDAVSGKENNEERINIVVNLLKMEKNEEAIPIMIEILEDEPKNLQVLKNLSVAYYQLGMCHETLEIYNRILELTPNASEIYFGQAVCYNHLGLPEKSLSSLDNIKKEYSSDNSVLLTKANAHLLLKEFEDSEKFYNKVLEKNPEHKAANLNLLLLSVHMKDHEMTKELLVKHLGNEPKRTSGCGGSGCMGKTPFLVPMKDSEKYSGTVQIQVRNSLDELITIVESNTITYTPHPIMEKILAEKGVVEYMEWNGEIIEIVKLHDKIQFVENAYFMDRIEYFYNDYSILFAYNLAVPIESGDYASIEWIIKKI
jgi:tetratricopeptide (TPR) repeat protein